MFYSSLKEKYFLQFTFNVLSEFFQRIDFFKKISFKKLIGRFPLETCSWLRPFPSPPFQGRRTHGDFPLLLLFLSLEGSGGPLLLLPSATERKGGGGKLTYLGMRRIMELRVFLTHLNFRK